MRLTAYSDHALRTLIFLALNRGLVTGQDIAEAHGIAKNDLTKVVYRLGQLGYLDTVRGSSRLRARLLANRWCGNCSATMNRAGAR